MDFDFGSSLERVAIENATLNIGDYLYLSGGLSFTRQQGMTVKLSDSAHTTLTNVEAFTFGAGNLDLFVGSGPYFVDSNHDNVIDESDTPDSNAVGLRWRTSISG